MAQFIPATFDLFEFDDSGKQAGPVRRWLDHWDGLVGQPAEEVTLGWSAGQTVALVCTSGREYSDTDARHRAVHLALGGITLPLSERPSNPADTHREIDRLSSATSDWYSGGGAADEQETRFVDASDFTTGYRLLKRGAIFIAATGLKPDQLRTRPVSDWALYDVDATVSFPLSALHRA